MTVQTDQVAYKRLIVNLTEEITALKVEAVVRDYGGKIIYSYKHIPFMVIEVPVEQSQVFMASELASGIMEDGEVSTQVQQVPWGVERIEATKVHRDFRDKGSGVKIGVIDTGISLLHPDVKVYGGANFTDSASYNDDNGHGTHVAGTIAALDNTEGVIGVAPDAQLYAVKVLNAAGQGTYTDVVAGIDWCIDNQMNIISMSLGGPSPNDLLKAAITQAWQKGLLIVAAAGNSGNASGTGDNVIYPAKYPEAIAVAALDSNNNRASFSSTGPAVEVAAPGVAILSTYLNSGYSSLSGTSMATPHVSGCAALIKAADPKLTNQQIRTRLIETALDKGAAGRDPLYGYGLISASAAVPPPTTPPPTTPPPTTPPPTTPPPTTKPPVDTIPPKVKISSSASSVAPGGVVKITATATDNRGIERVEFYLNGVKVSTVTTAPYLYTWNTTGKKAGQYRFLAKAFDLAGNTATSKVIIIRIMTRVTVTFPANGQLISGVINKFTAKFSDPVAGNILLYINGSKKATIRVSSTTGPITIPYTWNTSKLLQGSNHIILVRAYTADGVVRSDGSVKVTIKR